MVPPAEIKEKEKIPDALAKLYKKYSTSNTSYRGLGDVGLREPTKEELDLAFPGRTQTKTYSYWDVLKDPNITFEDKERADSFSELATKGQLDRFREGQKEYMAAQDVKLKEAATKAQEAREEKQKERELFSNETWKYLLSRDIDYKNDWELLQNLSTAPENVQQEIKNFVAIRADDIQRKEFERKQREVKVKELRGEGGWGFGDLKEHGKSKEAVSPSLSDDFPREPLSEEITPTTGPVEAPEKTTTEISDAPPGVSPDTLVSGAAIVPEEVSGGEVKEPPGIDRWDQGIVYGKEKIDEWKKNNPDDLTFSGIRVVDPESEAAVLFGEKWAGRELFNKFGKTVPFTASVRQAKDVETAMAIHLTQKKFEEMGWPIPEVSNSYRRKDWNDQQHPATVDSETGEITYEKGYEDRESSLHRQGKAVDWNVNKTMDSPISKRLLKVAWMYGLYQKGSTFSGKENEPWHWVNDVEKAKAWAKSQHEKGIPGYEDWENAGKAVTDELNKLGIVQGVGPGDQPESPIGALTNDAIIAQREKNALNFVRESDDAAADHTIAMIEAQRLAELATEAAKAQANIKLNAAKEMEETARQHSEQTKLNWQNVSEQTWKILHEYEAREKELEALHPDPWRMFGFTETTTSIGEDGKLKKEKKFSVSRTAFTVSSLFGILANMGATVLSAFDKRPGTVPFMVWDMFESAIDDDIKAQQEILKNKKDIIANRFTFLQHMYGSRGQFIGSADAYKGMKVSMLKHVNNQLDQLVLKGILDKNDINVQKIRAIARDKYNKENQDFRTKNFANTDKALGGIVKSRQEAESHDAIQRVRHAQALGQEHANKVAGAGEEDSALKGLPAGLQRAYIMARVFKPKLDEMHKIWLDHGRDIAGSNVMKYAAKWMKDNPNGLLKDAFLALTGFPGAANQPWAVALRKLLELHEMTKTHAAIIARVSGQVGNLNEQEQIRAMLNIPDLHNFEDGNKKFLVIKNQVRLLSNHKYYTTVDQNGASLLSDPKYLAADMNTKVRMLEAYNKAMGSLEWEKIELTKDQQATIEILNTQKISPEAQKYIDDLALKLAAQKTLGDTGNK
jgi:hypothetical protein